MSHVWSNFDYQSKAKVTERFSGSIVQRGTLHCIAIYAPRAHLESAAADCEP